jgi:hypothetical protein
MALFDRLFGRKKDDEELIFPGSTTGLPSVEEIRFSLYLLFPKPLELDAHILTRRLCAFHPAMNNAIVEIDRETVKFGTPSGEARWESHKVEIAGFNRRLTAAIVENCVLPAHYDSAIKQVARNHQAHVRLTYAGGSPIPLARYVALAAVAGTLGSTGACVVLNDHARTSRPIEDILPANIKGDRLTFLRTMRIPGLYSGFVEIELPGQGVWMRTHGSELLRMPNLAMRGASIMQSPRIQEIFAAVYNHIQKTLRPVEAGQTLDIGDKFTLRFRAPKKDEFFLHDKTGVLVVEDTR